MAEIRMMSDIEEPPTKVTKLESVGAGVPDETLEGMEQGQEEWLSEGVLTDDDYNQTMEQDGTFSNIGNTSQDDSQSTNIDSIENTGNPEIDPQEYTVQVRLDDSQVITESLQMDSQDNTENLQVDYQESVGNVKIEFQDNGENVKSVYQDHENTELETQENTEITQTEEQVILNTVEETLNNFENNQTMETSKGQADNTETLTEDLSMFLVKKTEIKSEDQKDSEDKRDGEKDDGNDTDELLEIRRSHVANMPKVVGERVDGWCGRESSSAAALRQAVRSKKRHQQAEVYNKLDAERQTRTITLYRVKEGPVIPAPQPPRKSPTGLACARCAPLSRMSWQDPKGPPDNGAVINILDIGRRNLANRGVVSKYFFDLAQCFHLTKYVYKDVVPDVVKDDTYRKAIEDTCKQELTKTQQNEADNSSTYQKIRQRVEETAFKKLIDISSAMSTNVLRFVAWLCHNAIRRMAERGCGTRVVCVEQLRRANATGLPLVFVPLHRSHLDYILVPLTLYLTGLRPPLVAVGENLRIPFFGWFLRGCGAFYIRRRIDADGLDYHGDPVYKSALRTYILKSLEAKNNLQFFIEDGRSKTGKPQPPKDVCTGILSVIMDAYLDGTIDDALLVPVTLNYDRLVDGNFVREQLGEPRQMETFWSALRGVWHAISTNHGGMRIGFNQPISLKELVTSFQKLNHLAIERTLSPLNNNSRSYGAVVSSETMVEAIGRHLVYDAALSTAVMSTNVVSYVLLTEQRRGATLKQLQDCVERRGRKLGEAGLDLGYTGEANKVLQHALEMLGRSLVVKSGTGDGQQVSPPANIPALLELSYYANVVAAHYAPQAIVATAMESIIQQPDADPDIVRHSELMEASLELCVVLSQEFVLCAPCRKTEDLINDTIQSMLADETISAVTPSIGLDEQQWSRRFAKSLEDDDEDEEREDPTRHIKYRVSHTAEGKAERRRLILTLRPLLEAYATTCRCVTNGAQQDVVKRTLHELTEDYQWNRVVCGEAVSMDAVLNCQRLLKQWGVIDIVGDGRDRVIRISPQFESQDHMDQICDNVYKFNVATPLLTEA